ncbi:MAG: S46 family peptidase [Bacteroidia bacterium]|nr:S46 family peptidase [Bacteroidia bacterium]
MKKTILFLTTILILITQAHADEGMWIPLLIGKNISDMQAKGCKLSAEDLYSANKSSLKDAVVIFGGGCTGEVISSAGLVLTNHHCGYSAIQKLSTVEKDYLMNGYAAMNKEEELPSAGLTVTFIVRIEDVTKQILDSLSDSMTEPERNQKITLVSAAIEKDATKETHYDAKVRSFYYGNEFYLFVTETFKDIRLVVAPPSAIGNFGGETDNWIWPRHTCDFSLFRIYANKENKPAEHSKENIPYTPKKHFTISLKGISENDFAMVYGFPGRTTEYIPESAVNMIVNTTDPTRVSIRDARLKIMNDGIHISDTVRLKYSPKYKGLANGYKKWQGEMIGIKSFDGLKKKNDFEKQFLQWANENNERKKKYGNVLHQLDSLYSHLRPLGRFTDYNNEAAWGVEILGLANSFSDLVALGKSDTAKQATLSLAAEKMKRNVEGFFKDYDERVDKEMFGALLSIYRDSLKPEQLPDYFKEMNQKFKRDMYRFSEFIFAKSIFASKEKISAVLAKFNKSSAKKIESDVAFQLAQSVSDNYSVQTKALQSINASIAVLMRTYMAAQREMQASKNFYPDANSTLRIAYGNIKGYKPNDGAAYLFRTTSEGIKEKSRLPNEEFFAPEKLLTLFEKKDFGMYGENSTLPICFLTTSHTTGGNSGSPVINATGELIGTNFDRVWEGTMSDIMFSPERCRNISVDIRYTLFIIDKFSGAGYLLNEMNVAK